MKISELKSLASKKRDLSSIPNAFIEEALLIRLVEQKFLDLFSKGQINGTVHTCVGQEFSSVAVAGQLNEDDWVTSNHRCHGHFISKTKNWQGLIDELMGLKTGVCSGVGSSQHLYAAGFMSNGPQAALVPVATGIALNIKLNRKPGIAVSFIGEGTLGEGVLYEAFNLASLYDVPHLIVCENNFYSQSTAQEDGVAGLISDRPKAFGIKVFEADTWDISNLVKVANEAISFVRGGHPAFLLIRTYRLNPHSKGDDNRNQNEIEFFKEVDVLNMMLNDNFWERKSKEIESLIEKHIAESNKTFLNIGDYSKDQLSRKVTAKLRVSINPQIRMAQALNEAYRKTLSEGAFHIGEDISDPYGGAFKVTKGLSSDFPNQVKSTSISESGLVGIAIGMSLMGTTSFAEIMFGDFMTHVFDQVLSNASKMHHMYAFQVSVPLRIRTPMGGKRGYGPTHSQSLEKYLLGIDNVGVIAFTSLLNPSEVIDDLACINCPMILIESKVDYGRYLWESHPDFELLKEEKVFGALKLSPKTKLPNLTIVSYGETARHIVDNYEKFFLETDFVPELICITQLHPLDLGLIEKSTRKTRKIIVVEDGSVSFGFGAEILSGLIERGIFLDFALRVGAAPIPIPSTISLEMAVLPSIDRIIKEVMRHKREASNA
jgi:2-oxoisovalerate dehydrogenase E1 component